MNKFHCDRGRRDYLLKLVEETKAAERRVRGFCEEWLRREVPCKPGDVVTATKLPHRGRQMVVEDVSLEVEVVWSDEPPKIRWKAIGRLLKADKTPGERRGFAYWEAMCHE